MTICIVDFFKRINIENRQRDVPGQILLKIFPQRGPVQKSGQPIHTGLLGKLLFPFFQIYPHGFIADIRIPSQLRNDNAEQMKGKHIRPVQPGKCMPDPENDKQHDRDIENRTGHGFLKTAQGQQIN